MVGPRVLGALNLPDLADTQSKVNATVRVQRRIWYRLAECVAPDHERSVINGDANLGEAVCTEAFKTGCG
jgi:hypothetical protein